MTIRHGLRLLQWCISAVIFLCAAATHAQQTLSVVVGYHKPPYVFGANDTGVELDIVRHIFKPLGYEIQPIYVPFGRTPSELRNQRADIGLTLNKWHDINQEWLTEPYIAYQNFAISLTKNNVEVSRIADLNSYSVVAFQSATIVLGPEYANAVKGRENYLELPEQQRQVTLLLRGNLEVAVLDQNIFRYFYSIAEPELQGQAITYHSLFPKSPYAAAIPDVELREYFNQRLTTMFANGSYQALLDKYQLVDILHSAN
ncbi:transporter substrate-binding domain-containing protein [Alteromonas sp. ASW11-36]|uniref:Transporter substrate-binding domain-containing protein n=1 Tax=Alteromonas arenosi TaxID=3055817 RepID=A0ABT7T192_9ALTE|nr:transporter substrate-binding domain-containing protein [Alteromonas sp. ASW11-36]MDM7862213.1 transporter substrate-binding domain-containing protein [Alteromonas sp. ASW11-36]